MNIGIIGAGMIGGTAARLFVQAGHDVGIANLRGPASLATLVAGLGARTRADTVETVARSGDVILLAIPFGAYRTLPARPFAGKIVVDAMNYYPQRDGQIDFGARTSSEMVGEYLTGVRLIKAFNTMYFQTLATKGRVGAPVESRLTRFVASDDPEAKGIVSRLIEEIGFAPVDTGSLHSGGARQQPGSPLYNKPLTGSEAHALLKRTP